MFPFKGMLYYTNTSKFRKNSSSKSNPFSASNYPKSVQSSAHVLPSSFSKMKRLILSSAAVWNSLWSQRKMTTCRVWKETCCNRVFKYWHLLPVHMIQYLPGSPRQHKSINETFEFEDDNGNMLVWMFCSAQSKDKQQKRSAMSGWHKLLFCYL